MASAAAARMGALSLPVQIPRAFALLLCAFAALHAGMLAYDAHNPERFVAADRADARLRTIEAFAALWRSGGDLQGFFAANGVAGDWLPQALLYVAGGPLLVIAVQVVLALAAIAWVREMGLRLGLPEPKASAAAVLYGLLPHSLVYPHQLASEAIFVPLVVLAFVLVMRGATAARQGGAGLAMGLAVLVRPVGALWPPIHALCAWRARPAARLAYLVAGLAPLALWVGFIASQTGVVSAGPSKHDLGHNLWLRVQRMAPALPPAERFADRDEPRIGVGEYLGFVARHPGAAAAHAGRDLVTLAVKSGIERLAIDYLGLFPESRALQDSASGWRKQVERKGPLAAMRDIAARYPALVGLSAAGGALFAVFMALAALGAYVFVRTGRFMLVAFVLYVFVTATAVDAAQSRHRAPAEFALCLLAVTGTWALRSRREGRGQDRRLPYRRVEPALGRDPDDPGGR